MAETKKLMVLAGGTGGHVFPALAVAKAMTPTGVEVCWLGTKQGLEARVVPENNIAIEWISISGLRGKGLLAWLKAPFKLANAIWQSLQIMRRVKPDCVLGMGGFVAGPGGLAARILGKPLVVHEQNAVAGLTNRYLAKIATKVLSGFPNVLGLPSSTQWVGNPVRQEIAELEDSDEQNNKINILIIGGSQGAYSFNTYLPKILAAQTADISIWHQSGKGSQEQVEQSYQAENCQAKVTDFIEDMAAAYQWSDLLICRAGAMTIAECCAAQKPALLVPYPFSAGDHQLKNAEAMAEVGAAVVVDNSTLQDATINTQIAQLLSDKSQLKNMGEKAQQLYKANSLALVVAVCEEYLHA